MRFRFPAGALLAANTGKGTNVDAPSAISHDIEVTGDSELKSKEAGGTTTETSSQSDVDEVNKEFQRGTQLAQAMAQVWTKRDLAIAYVFMWIVAFMMSFSSGITGNLTPYVTSSFNKHSLTAATDIMSYLIAGMMKLPYAKFVDIWGRPQGFAIMVACVTIGLVMMAGCNDVKTYAAAQVFYQVGSYGVDFTMTIFIADTSSLRNRSFMLGYIASPWLITTWVNGPAAESVLAHLSFRWGFGIFAIIIPITCAPLLALFWINQRKAVKAGLVTPNPSRGNALQTFVYYCREFDVIGLLLICTGLSLFLLAFSLYSYQADTWRSPLILCFLIFGFLLIVSFGLYERYLAPITFIPYHLITDRTIVFTYIMAGSLYTGWYIWNSYFYSMLIVVYNLSITHASYIGNIYTLGSCTWCLIFGVMVRYYGHLKWYSLFFGAPMTLLGVALMIAFRQPDVNIGYIVMSQIFVAVGGGTLVICEQMTVMAVSSEQHYPAVLAVEGLIISVGSSIGSAIAAAMWTGIFPKRLMANLPADAIENFTNIYGDLEVQSSYEIGSATRDAINTSYGQTQRYMLITSVCIYIITVVSVFGWRNIDVKNMKQRKHVLF